MTSIFSQATSNKLLHEHVMLPARFCWRNANRSLTRIHNRDNGTASLNALISEAPSSPQDHGTNASGPLAGRSVAVKDNITTSNLATTAASHILSGYVSPFDATVVKLLRENGAHISAKTNLDEFGMGSHSQQSAFGRVLSPYSRNGVSLSPGGSSGGSAVAVATGRCWAALGTDTGGSVRLPASYTGVVGFKPSYGLLSRWGVVQYANSLDTVGVLARSVQDASQVFDALNHYDEQDPTSLPHAVRQRTPASKGQRGMTSLRVGIPLDYNSTSLQTAVRRTYTQLLQSLQSAGHRLIPVSLPSTRLALSAYYVLAPAEASSNLAKYDGIRYGRRTGGPDSNLSSGLPLYAQSRGEGFGEEVKRRILLGAYTLSSEAIDNYFIQAQKVRRLVQQDFDKVFSKPNPLMDEPATSADSIEGNERVDVLVTPTAPTLPPTIQEVEKQTPVETYMNDVFTVPASLAGLPAASVPVRLADIDREGMEETDVCSVGMQVLGQFGDDQVVLEVAQLIESMQKSK